MVSNVVRLSVLGAAFFGGVLAAPFDAPKLDGRAGASVITKCTQPKTVALTFDDGPYVNTRKLVDLLDNNGAKGTWFVNGDNYGCIYDEKNADSIKYAYDKGHQIASHTWAHKDLTKLSGGALKIQFTKLDAAIEKITGAVPAYMRPPYGAYDDEVTQVAKNVGQKVVIWDFDSGDSTGKSASESKKAYDKLISKHPKNVLTLNHETMEPTVDEVIPHAIRKFKAKGYKLVTVAECLGSQTPYQSIGSPSARDSTWKC
ncbi:Carbohydrate esterase 4 protein [Ceratobasidium sp. 392]|nr:Carbohydrate esterase 4 protein [Ceratobasidium sp. 392]